MRLVVTGASGFIGRALVEWLAARGHEGCATGRTAPDGLPAGWRGLPRHALLGGAVRADPFDALVHLEVKHHVRRVGRAEAADLHRVNVGGTREWLAWAAAHHVQRVILASSVKAVRTAGMVTDENAIGESEDPYGRSKAEAEHALRDWVEADPRRSGVILRLAPVYGPGNRANLASFARQVIRGRPCLIGAGQARKSVLSRRNAVAAIEHCLSGTAAGCEVFNVADRVAVSLADLARFIAEACSSPSPRHVPWLAAASLALLGDAIEATTGRDFVMDSKRLHTLTHDAVYSVEKLLGTGYQHVQETCDGIAEMARWVRDHDSPTAP